VQYLGVAWDTTVDTAVLVTELMEGGSLFAHVHNSAYVATLSFAKHVVEQVAAAGVWYCVRS
jgi:hypothetical protein